MPQTADYKKTPPDKGVGGYSPIDKSHNFLYGMFVPNSQKGTLIHKVL
jgi:hypothetical protein